ncbi:hypothetical protein R1flu_014234 [Riccia fluitans]|uniref:Phosphotransferase n=1 Tax=Riccia fluitans TaxID=41844 RepID=A0ABD1YFR4_9MARC
MCGIADRITDCIGLKYVSRAVKAASRQIHRRDPMEECVMIVEQFRKICCTSADVLNLLVNDLVSSMEAGLKTKDSKNSPKMLPSFVENLPNGSEKGSYFALDLGGTNFRILHVELGGRKAKVVKQEVEECSIPEKLKIATGRELFDFIAEKLSTFVRKTHGSTLSNHDWHHHQRKELQLGFTFSFPVDQKSIDGGSLLEWTKGFKCDGVIGENVVQLLEEALARNGLEMKVNVLINDTVGTLAAGRYLYDNTIIAIILGTGTNSAYIESSAALRLKLDESQLPKSTTTVINTEWSYFWSPYLPVTDIDMELLHESPLPGQQQYEKLISGMYLGEIVRRVLQKLQRQSGVFGKSVLSNLANPHSLDARTMSVMHEDESCGLQKVAKVLEENFDIVGTSLELRRLVQTVCDVVCQRAGRLAAVGIVAMLKKIGWDQASTTITIAVDGGLYEHYKKFRGYLFDAMRELLGEKVAENISIVLCKDGSGIGAALLAASHS